MINLYRAIKSNHLNQAFGNNLPCAKLGADDQPIRPFQIVTGADAQICPVGYVKFYPLLGLNGHNGQDWMAYHGEPVYFNATDKDENPIEGTCYTEVDADGGKGVDVIFQDPEIKEWLQLKYWHLLEPKVYDGQKVKSGDLIGLADTTGASSGDHLHEGFKPLLSNNLEDKKFPNNGFTGAMNVSIYPNVTDYQNDSFILDILGLKQQLNLLQQLFKLLTLLKLLKR